MRQYPEAFGRGYLPTLPASLIINPHHFASIIINLHQPGQYSGKN